MFVQGAEKRSAYYACRSSRLRTATAGVVESPWPATATVAMRWFLACALLREP